MHGGMHEFIVSTWYVLLCVSWIVMFVDIDYRVLFAHGLVRFVDSWSLGGCCVMQNMTLGIVLV